MQKTVYGMIVVVLLTALFIAGCSTSTSTTTTTVAPVTTPLTTSKPATTAPSTTAPASTTTVAATNSPAAETKVYGGTLVINQNQAINNLGGPADVTSYTASRVWAPIFETLITSDTSDNFHPLLADSWNVSPDGKTITFNLHKGIKFTDGTDFDAQAVIYNLQLHKTNATSSAVYLKNVSGYASPDPYTLVINMNKYDASLMPALAANTLGAIASPAALKISATGDSMVQLHMVGTGPFKLSSWQRSNYMKYEKNPNYWQPGKPYLDGIEIRQVSDVTVSIMSFKAKECNVVITLDPVDAVSLSKAGYNVQLGSQFIHALYPDAANPKSPFADLKVRQALEYAIDRQGLSDGVGYGYFKPAYQFAYPGGPFYNDSLAPRLYDVQKAKKLLADAGYPNGIKTTLLTDVRVRTDTLTTIQTYLNQAGFDCTLDKADVARFTDATNKGWTGIMMPGVPLGSTLIGLVSRFDDPKAYPSMLRPAGFQEGWDAAASEPDINKRNTLIQAMVKMIYDQSIVIPYHTDTTRLVMDSKVHSFNFQTLGGDSWDVTNCWLSK